MSHVRKKRTRFLAGLFCTLATAGLGWSKPPGAAAPDAESRSAEVDKLFAAWNKPNSPGCALAIVQNNKVIYRKSYGMADLEHAIPITPTTVFHVASLSKQVTALAIRALADAGKVSLDEDIRAYLPAMPKYGKVITPRHLLHHTSGLRDQWDLLMLAGWRLEDLVTERDVLQLVYRQKELNFEPGEEYSYSNTEYTLLGQIVQRVTGKSLRVWTEEKFFKRMKMNHTHFRDDAHQIVQNLACPYSSAPAEGWQRALLNYGVPGATNLLTTVDDLVLWADQFQEGTTLIDDLGHKGKLNNGQEVDYAAGLVLGEYRGLKTAGHEGRDPGYRAVLLHFLEPRFTVIILANNTECEVGVLAKKIADLYLADKFTAEPPPREEPKNGELGPLPQPVALTSRQMAEYVGDFYSDELGVVYEIRLRDDRLMLRHRQGENLLRPFVEEQFGCPLGRIKFTRDNGNQIDGFTMTTKRIRGQRFVKVDLKKAKE